MWVEDACWEVEVSKQVGKGDGVLGRLFDGWAQDLRSFLVGSFIWMHCMELDKGTKIPHFWEGGSIFCYLVLLHGMNLWRNIL